jgi:hypothetical protein
MIDKPKAERPATHIEVRRGFGSIELSTLAGDEYVIASGNRDGGYIVCRDPSWTAVPRPAEQLGTPPTVKYCKNCGREIARASLLSQFWVHGWSGADRCYLNQEFPVGELAGREAPTCSMCRVGDPREFKDGRWQHYLIGDDPEWRDCGVAGREAPAPLSSRMENFIERVVEEVEEAGIEPEHGEAPAQTAGTDAKCPTCSSDDPKRLAVIEMEFTGGVGRTNLRRERWYCADPWHELGSAALTARTKGKGEACW